MSENFESKNIRETCTLLETDSDRGLSEKEAARRLEANGPNELKEAKKKSAPERFLEQLNDPLIYVLMAAAVISLLLHEISDAAIIAVVVCMNAMVGMIQEGKAQKALDSLKKLTSPRAYCIRDGKEREIAAAQLVPGDIVCLEAGCQVPADLLIRRIAVRHHEPGVGVGAVGISGFPERLLPSLRHAVIAGPPGIFLSGEVQQEIIRRFPHRGIVRQRLIAEAGGGLIRELLPNGVQVFLRIRKGLLLAAGIGHPAHQRLLLRHSLLAEVIAVQIALIVARQRGTAEAIAVVIRFRNVAVSSAIVLDSTAVAAAIGPHGLQILQRAAAAKFVQDLLKLLLKLRGRQMVRIVFPPCGPEFPAALPEVHPQVAHGAERLIFAFFHLGVEKARLLNGSGPQLNI